MRKFLAKRKQVVNGRQFVPRTTTYYDFYVMLRAKMYVRNTRVGRIKRTIYVVCSMYVLIEFLLRLNLGAWVDIRQSTDCGALHFECRLSRLLFVGGKIKSRDATGATIRLRTT